MGSEQLLLTKCLVPIVPQPLVERPRLNHLLESGLRRKLTLISAPAGFGKSTLVAAWAGAQNTLQRSTAQTAQTERARAAPQVAWLSLEVADNTASQFWIYTFAALEQILPEDARVALNAAQASQPAPLETILTAFINARLARPSPGVMVFDDYHVISDETIHRSLAFFLEHLPSQLHVMLLSRTEPPLPLARLRANRQINEIGVEELRCTATETTSFLHDVMGVQLEEAVTSQLMERTEGWLVGLQLLGLSLQGRRDPRAVLEEMRGSQRHVFDYLMDEVLRQQPQDWQRFLLHTSVLERMSAPLCDAVLERDDSRAMLERLERANLFVIALDERRQWFRYHHLFREALRTRLEALEPDVARGLHLRATKWFAANGDNLDMAFHVFQAEVWSRTASLSETERRAQTNYVAAARALMVALKGNAAQARELTRVALAHLPQESLLERSATLVAESVAAVVDGDYTQAHQTAMQAVELLRQAGHHTNALSLTAIATLYVHRQGRLEEAEFLLEQTLEEATQTDNAPAISVITSFQALLLLERNWLDAALDLATRAVQLAKQGGYDTTIAYGYPNLALIHLARGEYPQAQEATLQAIQLLPEHDTPFRRAVMITPIQVKLWLAQGELERAQEWAEQNRFGSTQTSPFARERLEVSRVRVALATGHPDEALEVLPELIAGATQKGRWDHVLEMWLLLAVAHHQVRNESDALEVLERAVAFGESQGYVRHFLDEGPEMAVLLEKLRARPLEAKMAAYLERLLAEFRGVAATAGLRTASPQVTRPPSSSSGLTHLTSRETEVLEFLARGLSNDDIARRMKVSQYTVKSHVGSLLSKLEAKNRTHAVARARALGLLENAP